MERVTDGSRAGQQSDRRSRSDTGGCGRRLWASSLLLSASAPEGGGGLTARGGGEKRLKSTAVPGARTCVVTCVRGRGP